MVQQIKVIHPKPDIFLSPNGQLDINYLEAFRDDTLILNYASEHWGPDKNFFLQLHDLLESHGFDFWILSHNPGDHKIRQRLIFYPWWYIHSVKKFENIDVHSPRTKIMGCLHGNPRPHRIAHYFAAISKFDAEKSYITIYTTNGSNSSQLTWRADDVELSHEEKDNWKLLHDSLPDRCGLVNDETINISALNDAYIHLTTETTVIDRIFISEKTWKPIAAGQLFLQFGNPGTVSFLRSLGVDTFDDIIDHDSYDHINDWRQRMHRIHDVVKDLMDQNIENIWKETLARRQMNKTRFFAGDFHGPFKFDVVDQYVSRR